ncbi:MAG TPA: DUF3883 domain-containing protein [Smithellaceae bacterium]|jgi:hypothetical protein|nr:DUF3883 domain-containing protein [Smithellaceae bacterium]
MNERRLPWTRLEVQLAVADYLRMLTLELTGQSYSKTAHRNLLKSKLIERSEASIERKHQNISAVLLELGCPYISGYKPLGNYQQLLFEIVASEISESPLFDKAVIDAVQQVALLPVVSDFSSVVVEPPQFVLSTSEPIVRDYLLRKPIHCDYLARESRNQSLGKAGEEFVLEFERHRLRVLGMDKESEKVEHVSQTKGDGLGYDILSFESSGEERFIEVKTTRFGKETPFFVSNNELNFSKQYSKQYKLFRLFEFRRSPKLFQLSGAVDRNCHLDPVSYRASFS